MIEILKNYYFVLTNLNKPQFECPVCNYAGTFISIYPKTGYRQYSKCPACSSFERHRLQKLVLNKIIPEYKAQNIRILHFAPEPFFRNYFSKLSKNYLTVDLFNENVDVNCDIKHLPFDDNKFDLVYASDVLEHIDDDRKTLSEINRILKPGAKAILPVPIARQYTVEYSEPNPEESDHYRAPGIDYFDKYKDIFSNTDIYQTYLYETPNKNNITFTDKEIHGNQIKYKNYVPVCISQTI